MDYTGVIIEESLGLMGVLKSVEIVETKIEPVTDLHRTPWLLQWTIHTVKVPFPKADQVALYLSKSFDPANPHWYADFKNHQYHYIIFPDKIFRININRSEEYKAVVNYGKFLKIPEYQLDFVSEDI